MFVYGRTRWRKANFHDVLFSLINLFNVYIILYLFCVNTLKITCHLPIADRPTTDLCLPKDQPTDRPINQPISLSYWRELGVVSRKLTNRYYILMVMMMMIGQFNIYDLHPIFNTLFNKIELIILDFQQHTNYFLNLFFFFFNILVWKKHNFHYKNNHEIIIIVVVFV